MIYTVTWTRIAEADLTNLWIQATDRQAVTVAAAHIEAVLRINPYVHSQAQGGNDRAMSAGPLTIAYSVSDPDCLVTIWGVWCTI
jgi:hypothetical protein